MADRFRIPPRAFLDKPFVVKDPKFDVIGEVYVDISRFQQYCDSIVDKTHQRWAVMSSGDKIGELDVIFGLFCILSNIMKYIFSNDFKVKARDSIFDLTLSADCLPLNISIRKIFLDTIECLNIADFYGFHTEHTCDNHLAIKTVAKLNYIKNSRVIWFIGKYFSRVISEGRPFHSIKLVLTSIFKLSSDDTAPKIVSNGISRIAHYIRKNGTFYYICLIHYAIRCRIRIDRFNYLLRLGFYYKFRITGKIVKTITKLSRLIILPDNIETNDNLLDIIKVCVQTPKDADNDILTAHANALWNSIATYILNVYQISQIMTDPFPQYVYTLLKLYSNNTLDEISLITYIADLVATHIDRHIGTAYNYIPMIYNSNIENDIEQLYETALAKPEIYPTLPSNITNINDLFENNSDVEVLANPVTPSSPAITYELISRFVNKLSAIPIYLPVAWSYKTNHYYKKFGKDRLVNYHQWHSYCRYYTSVGCYVKFNVIYRNYNFIVTGLPHEIIELIREFF